MTQEELFKNLIAHAKEYGFVFPSSEIYDGLSAVYDYGAMGVELKNNIKKYWWDSMVRLNENIVGLDSAIFMHPKIWEASGHVGAFNDPLIDNKDSKKRYRADVLLEDYIAKLEEKVEKEVEKGRKRYGDSFNEGEFRSTNINVLRNAEKLNSVREEVSSVLTSGDLKAIKELIVKYEIACPISGSKNWTDVRQFNIMFSTQVGSVTDDAGVIYLRPETAQGIFVNFLNVQKTSRMKVPFGIAQIGKAFRNEITPNKFTFRTREFEQWDLQYFVHPSTMEENFEYWKQERMNFYKSLYRKHENLRFYEHPQDKLVFYAKKAFDIEYLAPWGWAENEGIHWRSDYDLTKKLEIIL